MPLVVSSSIKQFYEKYIIFVQYFHNGQLKKAAEKERVAGRFELFFDLLYVALVESSRL